MLVNKKEAGVLKTLAIFEACKGLLVLLAGAGLFSLIHHDIQISAEQLLSHLHLNPAHHSPKIFIEAVVNWSDSRMRILAIFALLYSSLHFLEAYGLWFELRWAKWIALLSGCIYFPLELYDFAKGFTWFKVVLILLNCIIVLYMAVVLSRNRKEIKI